jgi:hypothetical protein
MAKEKDVQAFLHADEGAGVEKTPAVANPLEIPDEYRDPRLEADGRMPKAEDPNNPPRIAPLPVITKSVEQVYGEDVETVTMLFPRPVTIVNKDKIKIHFKAGPQEVPLQDADNWYLAANGVKRYKK